ncbi:MAG: tRNA lysidine(34) synthetase TilS [Pseudanabaenaceae cyanobacterium bins.39]|nr:tRNA lysidine(34) synthetase TilS [Pseudanabaenaceae cyanobacterium bins.39]
MASSRQFTKLLKSYLNAVLRSQCDLLPPHSSVLIAVSGGQDSLCLAQLLQMQQQKYNWRLTIAHCDHRWRQDSAANAEHVAAIANEWGLDFCQRVADYAPANEAAARQWRYQMLVDMAQERQCDRVAVGHTRSDRVETCLYNLMRGSGADGLAAMAWRRSLTDGIDLVRPLLNVSRWETGAFCLENQIPVWEDSTNQDIRYQRNRIRLETIPYLQENFNPQLEVAIAQTAEILQEDVAYLENQARSFFQENVTILSQSSSPSLHRQLLQQQPLALQRRIVRQFLSKYLLHQVNFADIDKFLKLLTAQNRSQTSPFSGNWIAVIEDPWIRLRR